MSEKIKNILEGLFWAVILFIAAFLTYYYGIKKQLDVESRLNKVEQDIEELFLRSEQNSI